MSQEDPSPSPKNTPKPTPTDLTTLFVETAQATHQRRQDHTTDARQARREYRAAAEQKIREALGVHGSLSVKL